VASLRRSWPALLSVCASPNGYCCQVVDDPASRSRPFVAAGALFWDDAGRVMLVRPTYKAGWDIPGGYVESPEVPRQTCAREIREELGLNVEPGSLLVADWAPSSDEGDKLLLVFDGGILSHERLAAIHLQADEIAEYAFRELAEACELLVPRLARRVAAAAQARSERRTVYLEHGIPVGRPT